MREGEGFTFPWGCGNADTEKEGLDGGHLEEKLPHTDKNLDTLSVLTERRDDTNK